MDRHPAHGDQQIGRIPVRNLWLLMLYASDLTRVKDAFNANVEDDISNVPDLVARLLTGEVERRLRRNLSRGFSHREDSLTRVRGRINILMTESRQLLSKGEVYCRFEELTIDTARNRLVRSALDLLARLVQDRNLVRKCRTLSMTLFRAGVWGKQPSRAELATDQIGRNDAGDRFMNALARLAFDIALPTEDVGATPFVAPEREEAWVRRLFEKAILGFARLELEPSGWTVRGGTPLEWQLKSPSPDLGSILPRMVTDIILDLPGRSGRLVIDTKFTSILGAGRFGNASLKSGHLYQMYAYLRSQEGDDPLWDSASGLLLHPSVGSRLYEHATIQGHTISFATVDLTGTAQSIRSELRSIFRSEPWR